MSDKYVDITFHELDEADAEEIRTFARSRRFYITEEELD